MFVSRKALPASVAALAVALGALLLSACGSGSDSALSVAFVGTPGDLFQPGVRLPPAGQLVRAATVEGLVAFDEQGRVIPAIADRWIVTDDGQSYIFRLRDGNWRSGDPLTGGSARKSMLAALKALDGTPLALDLEDIEDIRAMAGRVIEIRLKRPMPFLLQLLAQPELGLVHDKRGAGPMTLAKTANTAVLSPIDPARLGLPAVADWAGSNRAVHLRAQDGAHAIAAFNAGEVDLVLGGKIQDFPLTSSVGILRGTIQLDPVTGLFGLQVMRETGFLATPANREAVAMGIDRDKLMAPFRVGGWTPTSRIVAPGIEGDGGAESGGERWSNQTLEQRRAVAAGRVQSWRAAQGAGLVNLRLALPSGEGSRMIFDRLSNDMAAIGITLVRAGEGEDADLSLVDEVARYPRASWFLHRLSCVSRRGLCSAEADARVAQSNTASPSERAVLLGQAEQLLTDANVYIPFGTPIRWSLVRGSVNGFSTNQWGWHPLMPLAQLPK